MSSFNKILITVLAIGYMAIGSSCVYGQVVNPILTAKKHKNNLTIGFQTGTEAPFNSQLLNSGQIKTRYAISSTLVLRKTINQHFKIESGLKYSVVENSTLCPTEKYISSKTRRNQPCSVSLPFTIQYYFLPENSRVRPYVGAGMQYNLVSNFNTISPFTTYAQSDINSEQSLTGTKYINILFTQGITFEINTKIQLSQSIHFKPGNPNKTIGIDLGIGYKLP